MDFDETKLKAGKGGRREREDVLGKLRGDFPFLKNNEWVQYVYTVGASEMEKINSVVLWEESRSPRRFGRLQLNALNTIPLYSLTLRIPATAKFSSINPQ